MSVIDEIVEKKINHIKHKKLVHRIALDTIFYTNYNTIRRMKVLQLATVLSEYSEFLNYTSEQQTNLLIKLERACYNYTIDKVNDLNIMSSWDDEMFCNIYHSICYKLTSNLEPSGLVGCTTLITKIFNNEDPKKIITYKATDICPEKYKHIIQRIKTNQNISQTIKTSTLYKCGRCKENKCTIASIQNRSLDESNSILVTCVNCGYQFTT